MKIMSMEWLEQEEQRRIAEAELRGAPSSPRYTFGEMVQDIRRGILQNDPAVVLYVPPASWKCCGEWWGNARTHCPTCGSPATSTGEHS